MINENLCSYDTLNPSNFEEDGDRTQPRNDCYCDNCFYGRDKLALLCIEALQTLKLAEPHLNGTPLNVRLAVTNVIAKMEDK
jgi:hypothetical protein